MAWVSIRTENPRYNKWKGSEELTLHRGIFSNTYYNNYPFSFISYLLLIPGPKCWPQPPSKSQPSSSFLQIPNTHSTPNVSMQGHFYVSKEWVWSCFAQNFSSIISLSSNPFLYSKSHPQSLSTTLKIHLCVSSNNFIIIHFNINLRITHTTNFGS